MRACTPAIQAWKSVSVALTFIALGCGLFRAFQGLENVAFENFHLFLGGFQLLLAEACQLEAALVIRERVLERKLAAFHARHDSFQLGERLLESRLGGLR